MERTDRYPPAIIRGTGVHGCPFEFQTSNFRAQSAVAFFAALVSSLFVGMGKLKSGLGHPKTALSYWSAISKLLRYLLCLIDVFALVLLGSLSLLITATAAANPAGRDGSTAAQKPAEDPCCGPSLSRSPTARNKPTAPCRRTPVRPL